MTLACREPSCGVLEEVSMTLNNLKVCTDDTEELGCIMDDCCELNVVTLDAIFIACVADVEQMACPVDS